MGFSIHKLQFTTVHQLRDMPNMKLLNTFPKLDKITDQTNFRVPKNKPPWQSGTIKISYKCKQIQGNNPQKPNSGPKEARVNMLMTHKENEQCVYSMDLRWQTISLNHLMRAGSAMPERTRGRPRYSGRKIKI